MEILAIVGGVVIAGLAYSHFKLHNSVKQMGADLKALLTKQPPAPPKP